MGAGFFYYFAKFTISRFVILKFECVLVNQNHTALMTIFLLHTKCIVKQCNFQSPAEMWTKQKVKFLELRKIIIYWLLRHLSILHKLNILEFFNFHTFSYKKVNKFIMICVFFTHFNAVKRPQNIFFLKFFHVIIIIQIKCKLSF